MSLENALYYFSVLDCRGIVISKTVALTLLTILIRNSQHSLHADQRLCTRNFNEIELLQI